MGSKKLSFWQKLISFDLIQSYLVEHGHVNVVSKNINSIIDSDKIKLEPLTLFQG